MNKYIYAILDVTKSCQIKYGQYEFLYEPIYIGTGNYNRWNSHFVKAKRGDTRTHIRAKIKQLMDDNTTPTIKILHENLTKDDASNIEKELISIIGRRVTNSGPLYNTAIGGEGGDTYTNNPNRQNILNKLKSRPAPWNKGKTQSNDIKVKSISTTLKKRIKSGEIVMPSRKGILWSDEMKMKLSLSHKGIKLSKPRIDAKKYKFTNSTGETFILMGERRFNKFLEDNYPTLTKYKLLHHNNLDCKLEII
jgi:hypothetical protein